MNDRSVRRHATLRGGLKSSVRQAMRIVDGLLNRLREPSIIGAESMTGLENLAGIYPSTILLVRHAGADSENHISLGKGVYLGRRVELEAGQIDIDDDTSLQDGSAVRGRVSIGAHCLVGHNALIIASSHRYLDNPEQLIRDQDENYRRNQQEAEEVGAPRIRIDDDCWLGWSCTVMPGVHIGRGAILGANSVISNDVRPYEIHGGIPNRKIGDRLVFSPPRSISASNNSDLPYFYRGFFHSRAALEQSREFGAIFARSAAAIILAGARRTEIRIRGIRLDREGKLTMRFWLNGVDIGCRVIEYGPFEFSLSRMDVTGQQLREVPAMFQAYTLVEWQHEGSVRGEHGEFPDATFRYGILCAELAP